MGKIYRAKYIEIEKEGMIRYVFCLPDFDTVGDDRIVSYHNIIEPYAILKDYFAKEMENIEIWKKIE